MGMKIKFLTAMALCLGGGMALLGCRTGDNNSVKGSGNIKTEKRTPGNFIRISINGAYTVIIKKGIPEITLSADDNILPLIKTEIRSEILNIYNEKSISPEKSIEIVITAPSVQEITLAGAGKITAEEIQENTFSLNISGAVTLTASGKAEKLDIQCSGASNLQLKNLITQNAAVNLSGAGNISLYASDTLNVNVSGVGKVNYWGNPKNVQKKISGLGMLKEEK